MFRKEKDPEKFIKEYIDKHFENPKAFALSLAELEADKIIKAYGFDIIKNVFYDHYTTVYRVQKYGEEGFIYLYRDFRADSYSAIKDLLSQIKVENDRMCLKSRERECQKMNKHDVKKHLDIIETELKEIRVHLDDLKLVYGVE